MLKNPSGGGVEEGGTKAETISLIQVILAVSKEFLLVLFQLAAMRKINLHHNLTLFFRDRHYNIVNECLTSTSKLTCKGNLSSDRTDNHILVVLKDVMVLVNCCYQLNIRWQHCRISVNLGGVQWIIILFETGPYKNRSNKKIWEWICKGIGLDAPGGMKVYLIWFKNPKWIYKV